VKKTAVAVCPGRGTYNKDELGYLSRYHADKSQFISSLDDYRRDYKQTTISELDLQKKFKLSLHSTGINASPLIYACALADFQSIDRDNFEIIALAGNSMGWYLALAAGGATSVAEGMHIVNTMGTMMHQEAEGGQVIYPLCDDNWQADKRLQQAYSVTLKQLAENEDNKIYQSIDLGFMSVLAANDEGVKNLLAQLPKTQSRYPFALPFHGAFHSPLMRLISDKAMAKISQYSLAKPNIPLIDGRGYIWQPHSCDVEKLYRYTFDHQICETYNFSKAIEVACKEFAPDCVIVLGPGSTLGPPVAQQLIKMRWHNINSKQTFKTQQNNDPFVLNMGIEDQRTIVTR